MCIVGWALGASYLIHIAGPLADTCNQGDDSAYVTSLVLGPLMLAASFHLSKLAAQRIDWARWFAASLLLVIVVAAYMLVPVLSRTTVAGGTLCQSSAGVSWIDRVWAPAQLMASLLFGWGVLRIVVRERGARR